MTSSSPIQTQPEPEHIARAGDLLEALLLGNLTVHARLAIGRALATLADVHPPYPPRPDVTEALAFHPGLDLALQELKQALHQASSTEEAIRVGTAGRALQPLRPEP
jgi:hypothetical protein